MRFIKPTSYFLLAFSILFLFYFHLMIGLIGGITLFLIVNQLHDWLGTKVHSKFAHKATMLAMTIFTVLILSLIGVGIYSGLTGGQSHFANLSNDVLNVIQQLKNGRRKDNIFNGRGKQSLSSAKNRTKKHLPQLFLWR